MGDPLTGVAMALLARYGSNILTKPAALKAMVTVANPEFKDKMRRNNYLRLIRLAFDDENPVPEGMTMDDFRDPEKALNFLMGAEFSVNEDGESLDVSEAVPVQPNPVDVASRKVAPNIPEKKVSICTTKRSARKNNIKSKSTCSTSRWKLVRSNRTSKTWWRSL